MRHVFPGLAVLATAGALGLIAIRCERPPAPLDAGAPPGVFSAGRALRELAAVEGGGAPHPNGSLEIHRVREYLLARLTELGYRPEVQELEVWSKRRRSNIVVRNILARRDGREFGDAVLLSAHYDSVAAGPGATDDGVGVATVLETARVLASLPAARHDVVLLLTDAEEQGLLGARAFFAHHEWAAEIRAAVNVDAGGDRGQSVAVEITPNNRWLVGALASELKRPAGSSVVLELKRLINRSPADSDFYVARMAGVPGIYFANFIGGRHHHRASDTLANVSLATLQHHGDNVLAMVRWLSGAEIGRPPSGDDLFVSLFSRWVIHYPIGWALPLAAAAAVLSAAAVVRLWRKAGLTACSAGSGVIAWSAATVAGIAGGLVVGRLLRAAFGARALYAHSTLAAAVIVAASIGIYVATQSAFRRRTGVSGLAVGALFWWSAIALSTAAFAPGFSIVTTWPVLAAALGALAVTFSKAVPRPSLTWAAATPAILVATLLYSPLIATARAGFGPLYPGIPAMPVLMLGFALPLAGGESGARLRLLSGAAICACVAVLAQSL